MNVETDASDIEAVSHSMSITATGVLAEVIEEGLAEEDGAECTLEWEGDTLTADCTGLIDDSDLLGPIDEDDAAGRRRRRR